MSLRSGAGPLLLLTLAACQAREVTVFELAAGGSNAGSAGELSVSGGGTDAASGGGGSGGGSGGGGGSGSGGGGADGGAPASDGGGGGEAGGTAGQGTGGDGGIPCRTNEECGQGWFCEKVGCDAEMGLCDLRPSLPTFDISPVCGCDGVTYWNDVARRQFGMVMRQANQCSTDARPCNSGVDCGGRVAPFASCARLVSRAEACGAPTQGACWLLPPDCPPFGADPVLWQDCRSTDPNAPPICVDTCRAIRSERPHQQPADLKMCPN